MKTITVQEMVPAAAWPEIEALLAAGKMTAADFKPVLRKYEAEMLAKGVVADWAAYALEHACNEARKAR